jgi:phosphatidylglycerophosphatase A
MDAPGNRSFWQLGPAVWLATGLGVGLLPLPGPGTTGALVWGLPLAWALHVLPAWGQGLVIVGLALAGIPLCAVAASRLQLKDPSSVVFDEIVSVPITFLLAPLRGPPFYVALVLLIGLALNRLFDIWKPPPVKQLERLPGGLGVMADDWAAGAYGLASLQLLLWSGALDSLRG